MILMKVGFSGAEQNNSQRSVLIWNTPIPFQAKLAFSTFSLVYGGYNHAPKVDGFNEELHPYSEGTDLSGIRGLVEGNTDCTYRDAKEVFFKRRVSNITVQAASMTSHNQ